jgi:cytochrome c2
MRKVYLKYTTISTIIFIAVAVVGLAWQRTLESEHGGHVPADKGAQLFAEKGCARCHPVDSREGRIGPGLEGLFERERLPVSDREVTEQNVRNQLVDPYQAMPSYKGDLTEDEVEAVIDYLKTL